MTRRLLSVTYLLDDTALFGGVKVPLLHANLLAGRGHHVTVVSKGERPAWFPVHGEFLRVPSFDPERLPVSDVTVATFWTTIGPAAAARAGQAVHYCQGFEASYTHNTAEHGAILEAYRTPIPCIAVSPHLVTLVRERFGRPGKVVPPALERFWKPHPRWRPHRTPRLLVVGPFEVDWKGAATGLEAVRILRGQGLRCRLVRLSQWPLSEAERTLLAPDEFHCHVEPRQVARLLRGVDLLLAPSWAQEGFGLPVLEAMACGVPVVASDIPSFRSFAGDAAVLVPFDQPRRFAAAAAEILGNPRRWRRLRSRGAATAKTYAASRVAPVVEEALCWVAERGWVGDR